MVSFSLSIRNVLHENSYTETMDCIHYLLSLIGSQDDTVPERSLSRAVVTLSHYLAEIMFWDTVNNFIEQNRCILSQNVISHIKSDTTLSRVSLSKAIEEWPVLLTSKSFNFNEEPFQSFIVLINHRNKLTHSNDLDMVSYHMESYESAASAYYTAMKISEEIEKHFFPGKDFHYKNWYESFPPSSKKTYQQTFNEANRIAISYNTLEEQVAIDRKCGIPINYKTDDFLNFRDVIRNERNEVSDIFDEAFQNCNLEINSHTKFITSLSKIGSNLSKQIMYKIKTLLLNLNKQKVSIYFGIKFGEIIPHTRLKIKRLKSNKWPGFMRMKHSNLLLIFQIDKQSINIYDLIQM